MFLRFIFYTILAYIILRFVTWLISAPSNRKSGGRTKAGPRAAQMVRCGSCGMFITQNSALVVGGRGFCSRACAQSFNKA